MEESKEIVKKPAGAIMDPTAVQEGFEEPIDPDDLIISRATLLQALSPDVVAHGDKFRPGMVIDSVTKDILPAEFIPLYKFTNYIRFNPRNSKDPVYDPAYGPGEIIWRTTDPLDPRVQKETKFGDDGSNPIAIKFLNFMSYFPGVDMPIAVSFSRTSYKAGKKLLNLGLRTKKSMFATKYKLSTVIETNSANQQYFVFEVDSLGPVTEEEFALAKKMKDIYALNLVKIQPEQTEEHEQPLDPTLPPAV